MNKVRVPRGTVRGSGSLHKRLESAVLVSSFHFAERETKVQREGWLTRDPAGATEGVCAAPTPWPCAQSSAPLPAPCRSPGLWGVGSSDWHPTLCSCLSGCVKGGVRALGWLGGTGWGGRRGARGLVHGVRGKETRVPAAAPAPCGERGAGHSCPRDSVSLVTHPWTLRGDVQGLGARAGQEELRPLLGPGLWGCGCCPARPPR